MGGELEIRAVFPGGVGLSQGVRRTGELFSPILPLLPVRLRFRRALSGAMQTIIATPGSTAVRPTTRIISHRAEVRMSSVFAVRVLFIEAHA